MSEEQFDVGQWLIIRIENEDEIKIVRLRTDKPFNQDIAEYDKLLIIKWQYDDSEARLPTKAETEEINEFESSFDELTGDNGNSHLMLVKTGLGEREWIFYVKDPDRFMARFNQLLADKKELPLNIAVYQDPDWQCWRENALGHSVDGNAAVQFWQSFEQQEARFFKFEEDLEAILDELIASIKRVNPHLTCEFGSINEGKREFIISAGGIEAAFPAAQVLAETAPALSRFIIRKFRPRMSAGFTLEIGGKKITPEDLCFSLAADEEEENNQDDEQRVAIALFIRGYCEAEEELYGQIGFLVLDALLGEYDVATKVGNITFSPYEAESDFEKYPITALAAIFDQHFNEQIN